MEQRTYYYGIDAVRFACALMVAGFHIGFSCWASPRSGGALLLEKSYALPEFAWLLWPGWVGVEIFFVISGFVISASAAAASPGSFVKGRVLRLYPAVWICATLTVLLLVHEHHPKVWAYPTTMLLVPSGPWIDGQYWTLGVEIVFYTLVFGLVAVRRFEKIYLLAAVLGIGSSIYTIALVLGFEELGFLSRGVWRLTLLNYGADFALGILIFAFATRRLDRRKALLGILLLAGITAEIFEHTAGMATRTTNSPFYLAERWWLPAIIFGSAVAAILLSVRYSATVEQLPAPARRVLRLLGLSTYPLYLIHFSIGIVLTRELVQRGLTPLAALALTLAILTGAAAAIAALCEPTVRRALRYLWDTAANLISLRAAQARAFLGVGAFRR